MNSIDPVISVIVPMYNAEKYIAFCLESILGQTFNDYEIILIDDDSKDNTYQICMEYCKDNSAIRLERNKVNSGQFFCQNKGIDMAKGKYVYFVDSDDEIMSDALAVLYRKAEQENADVVHANLYITSYAEGRMISRKSLWEVFSGLYKNEGTIEGSLEQRIHIYTQMMPMTWLSLIRKDFLNDNGIRFRGLRRSEDDVFNLELILKAKKYVTINEVLNIYRRYYDEEKRTAARLSQVFVLLQKVIEAYNDVFSKFTLLELPASLRLSILLGWLEIHMQFWIYEIIDTRDEKEYFSFVESLKAVSDNNEYILDLLPLLVCLIDNESGVRKRIEQDRAKMWAVYANAFKDIENGEHEGDYAYIYSIAKRASLQEIASDSDSLHIYCTLARAAFQLCKYQEAWKAYETALKFVSKRKQEKKRIFSEMNAIRPYLEAEGTGCINFKLPEVSRDAKSRGTGVVVTLGVCTHYYSITDEMLVCWRIIMQKVPEATLIIAAEEFQVKAMMIEAMERCLVMGFNPTQVRFEIPAKDCYQGIDIMLDTYPVSGGAMLSKALLRGIPVITLFDSIETSKSGAKVLYSAGLEELAVQSREEYIAKAAALAKDHSLLQILKKKLPNMLIAK